MSSYPTIKFFPKGTTEPVEYDGARTEDAFVAYLNEKCGTHRAAGGLLNEKAGRLAELDAIALKATAADTNSASVWVTTVFATPSSYATSTASITAAKASE